MRARTTPAPVTPPTRPGGPAAIAYAALAAPGGLTRHLDRAASQPAGEGDALARVDSNAPPGPPPTTVVPLPPVLIVAAAVLAALVLLRHGSRLLNLMSRR